MNPVTQRMRILYIDRVVLFRYYVFDYIVQNTQNV
jgi:hypothetical protein